MRIDSERLEERLLRITVTPGFEESTCEVEMSNRIIGVRPRLGLELFKLPRGRLPRGAGQHQKA